MISGADNEHDWFALLDYSVPPVFEKKFFRPDGTEAETITTSAAEDFPELTAKWASLPEHEQRDLWFEIGGVHLALGVVARLVPRLRDEARRRLADLDRRDPRGLGRSIEAVINNVRQEAHAEG